MANPIHILKGIAAGLMGALKGSTFNKARYLSTLKMMYQFLNKVRKEGLLSVEMDVEKPKESAIFKNYPEFLSDHHARDFVCDTLRTAITGGVEPFDMDQMMELDMEVHHHAAIQPVNALTTVADALPGLGIVAAVLGVVITMGSLGGPPEEIGEKVAAALVGTFLGILLCYGVAGPLSSNMSKTADEHNEYLHVLRVLLLAFLKGSAPMIAIEMGRRAIPAHVRPSFDEMEKSCKRAGAAEAMQRKNRGGRGRQTMTAKAQPIIVIKKKGGHGGHHGGAWKVAYADFVTAMMSLFIVLWLMGSSEKVKRAVAGYFNDPKGTGPAGHHHDRHRRNRVARPMNDIAETERKARRGDQGEQGTGEAVQADRDHHHRRGSAHRTDRGQERHVLPERQRATERQRAGAAGAAGAELKTLPNRC